jgi:hypothetical protein
MSIKALLRDARATGEAIAAIDHLLQLGYDLSRAERACRPYVDPVASAFGLLSLSDQEAAAQAASDAAIARGFHADRAAGIEDRPLAWAYLQIECARQIADLTWEATSLMLFETDRDEAVHDLLAAAAARARGRWNASDEVREYAFGGESLGGGRERGHYHAPSEVEDALRAWTEGGDWETSEGTFWINDYAWPIDPATNAEVDGDRVSVTVAIEPEAPSCASGQEHDWQSPYSVLGGLRENPGVCGKGGGMISREVCAHCGIYRVTDTWAQDRSTGIQGLTSVSYEDADEDSREWIAGRQRRDADNITLEGDA